VSVPWVRIIPDIESSSKCLWQISASVFQSWGSMSSENFMKGDSIIGLQIFLSSGAIVRIASLSVGMVAPDFGSSLEEIVPPVIIIAMFGSFELVDVSCGAFDISSDFFRTLASSIWDSLIPML